MNSTSICGRVVRPATLILAAVLSVPAVADTWMLPETTQYLSADRFWRLTVIPRDLIRDLAEYRAKGDGREPAAAMSCDKEKRARGIMERFEHGQWQVVWDKPLLNDVSPLDVLVASTGQVVTFDNWHSVGHGCDTVVIYDAQGNVVRALALDDFLPDEYINALPHTVSSLYWGGEHCITGGDRRLVLRVIVPRLGFSRDEETEYVDVVVDLASGRVTPPQGSAWVRARAYAWIVNALRRL